MATKKFSTQYFIFPASKSSNKTISQHPSLIHVEPDYSAMCFVGKNKIILPLFQVSGMILDSFKESEVSFYAFIQKTKDGARQYFFSKKLQKEKNNALAEEVEKLLEKIKK